MKPLINGTTPMFIQPGLCLPFEFFARDTVIVAKQLLGHTLVRIDPLTQLPLTFKVVETEAYTEDDPACHAYQKKTGRAETLYKAPGLAYVYFIYGMYHCLNVVTDAEGKAGAVLFRALEAPFGSLAESPYKTNGPGRLARALNITKAEFNEKSLLSPDNGLYLVAGNPVVEADIVTTTRIGISKAQERPWRFYLKNNPWVSVR